MRWINSNRRFIKYLLVGGTAAGVEGGSFVILLRLLGAHIETAQFLSYIIGLLVSFLGSRFWTFRTEKDEGHRLATWHQATMFLVLGLTNSLISTGTISALVRIGHLNPLIAKIAVMCMIIVWNYLIMQKIIFARKTKLN